MLDPRRLLTFRAVAQAGSFSAAARELSLTQPAVSQQVAALERELGARLLHRGAGRADPDGGGDGGARSRAGAGGAPGAGRRPSSPSWATTAGALRVGGFPSALATLVPAAIASVVPQRVEAVEGTVEELAAGVADGSLHVAVLFQDAAEPRREHAGLRRHELLDEPFVIAVGPEHRLARRRAVRLPRARATTRGSRPPSAASCATRASPPGFEPDIVFVTRDVLAIRALVAAGAGGHAHPRLIAGHLHGVRVLAAARRVRRAARCTR